MSAGVVTLQAQVESVLVALVKAATVELTQLFESRYRALEADVSCVKVETANETLETLDVLLRADTKRSVGVQVDGDVYVPYDISGGSSFLSNGDCLGESKDMVVEGGLIPSEILLADPEWSSPKEAVTGDPDQDVDVVELGVLEAESQTDSDTKTEVVLHVSAETWTDALDCGSTKSSSEQQPIVIQPDTSEATSGEKVKFVCPLILKTTFPEPKIETLEKPGKDEPVSTAKGTAYSPSPLDGAVTPDQVGVWERVQTPKEDSNHLLMKLKLSPPDKKLLRPCAVQLVNVLTIPESEMRVEGDASKPHSPQQNPGWPLPKDLRRHQGLHTGHRLCCFSNCGNGIWRLQQVVARSRGGYPCNTCGKTFKRRKILRRHERFHTGEKPYTCPKCLKTFALRKSLRRHMRFHTGERPHTCAQCGKSFRLRDNLKTHLRFHTGEKPFSCAICGKMFRILRNLEKHRLTQCENFVPSFRKIAGL